MRAKLPSLRRRGAVRFGNSDFGFRIWSSSFFKSAIPDPKSEHEWTTPSSETAATPPFEGGELFLSSAVSDKAGGTHPGPGVLSTVKDIAVFTLAISRYVR